MRHEVERISDPLVLARTAAAYIAERAHHSVNARGHFNFAVSGGRNPWTMFRELALLEVPWASTTIFQVDERVAPSGDPDRNLTYLTESLSSVPARIVAMPVEEGDLDLAASNYADELPELFDLVHLGIGPDGHTASLVPDDPVLEVTDRLVAITRPYQDRQRMTLTYPALARADQLLWLITGEEARPALAKLLAGDASIPAGRVRAGASIVMTDEPTH